ncbi:hypothetical protein [Halobaculum litoreum]|nr:hypothetical protein [Halobaculum sp. DT92]
MGASIGGVEVVKGTRVKWGLLGSILVGGPLYAYFEGVIGLVQLVGGGIGAGLDGVEWFVSELVGGVFSGVTGSIGSAWAGFLVGVRFAGPGAFAVTVGATMLTLFLFVWGVSRVRG